MTPLEAIKFLTEAAWKNHRLVTSGDPRMMTGYDPARSCACLKITGPDKVTVGDEALCNCGAREHNAKVKEALLTIGKARKK